MINLEPDKNDSSFRPYAYFLAGWAWIPLGMIVAGNVHISWYSYAIGAVTGFAIGILGFREIDRRMK